MGTLKPREERDFPRSHVDSGLPGASSAGPPYGREMGRHHVGGGHTTGHHQAVITLSYSSSLPWSVHLQQEEGESRVRVERNF